MHAQITESEFEYFEDRRHTITGLLCMATGFIINGLPVILSIFVFE
jgi:hypothetical protein